MLTLPTTRIAALRLGFAALLLAMCAAPAEASERRFTYTYETAVLPPGAIEIEPWTTWRFGRDEFYNRFDERIELEVGLTERLQTAWYLNFGATTQDAIVAGERIRTSTTEFKGVSSEWKLKLSDPVADAIGSALYFEVSGGPTEAELEAKVLLDKRFGNVITALNIVGEYEWEFEGTKGITESVLELDAGVAYLLTPTVSIGLEARSHTEAVDGEIEHTAVFGGVAASYAKDKWWVAATVMPQLVSFGGAHGHAGSAGADSHDDSNIDLAEHERVEARVLFGIHL